MNNEKLLAIEEIHDLKLANIGKHSEKAQLGMIQMLHSLMGYGAYDGYKITTSEQEYLILIDNGRCCCESWGYFSSEDDFGNYIGKTLLDVSLTDKALNSKKVEESGYLMIAVAFSLLTSSLRTVLFCSLPFTMHTMDIMDILSLSQRIRKFCCKILCKAVQE